MFNGVAFNKLLFQYIFFYVPIKLDKNTANAYTYEKYSKQYYVCYAGTTFTRTTDFFIII